MKAFIKQLFVIINILIIMLLIPFYPIIKPFRALFVRYVLQKV